MSFLAVRHLSPFGCKLFFVYFGEIQKIIFVEFFRVITIIIVKTRRITPEFLVVYRKFKSTCTV